ncbi:MAG: polymer-forming cytoskeletal protein [Polyangiaceae bacterium]
MADVTVIGRGSKIRGRITGDGSLEILGHVEGEVQVSGDVTVGEGGLVGSSLAAQRLVVDGAVKGDLSASESIALGASARVVGDIRAPRVTIAAGALVRGHVQTTEGGASASARKPATAARPAAPARAAAPAAAPARQAPPPPKSSREVARPAAKAPPPAAPRVVTRKAPPAPVVPVLKKGAKGAMKKRAGG